MEFFNKNANPQGNEDTIFKAAHAAKAAIDSGATDVINATIGTLCDENEQLVVFKSVFEPYDALSHPIKARYAWDFSGNPDFQNTVASWVLDKEVSIPYCVCASMGGSGAVHIAMTSFADQGDLVLLPQFAWPFYSWILAEHGLREGRYPLFNEKNEFDLTGFADTVKKAAKGQKRLLIVLNDPAHNPTGYSLSESEWEGFINILNDISKDLPLVVIQDVAYIDYQFDQNLGRKRFNSLNRISDNILWTIAFSISKTMTSYGLRCGALLALAQSQSLIDDCDKVLNHTAGTTWSSIPNAAMENFVCVIRDHYDAFIEEKQYWLDLMKKRAEIFLNEAKRVGLELWPYKEGFFCLVKADSASHTKAWQARLAAHHVFTVPAEEGLRVALCALSCDHLKQLPALILKDK
ncbi:MAG: aminotransferase class I/II-fold pyridoxal phosphate-dependent enzyme [Erysipelotrichaceae bacterium]|jgi:aspartate aminotransferase/aromatic-amino-acid transaminase|nr:aminotransferase class I/II-fold pyridoxal phosphate-dependent enzyme [Erysipelotrichaceae bacterium]